MGFSVGRFIFVAIPFILTLVTLAGLLLTFTGNVSTNSIAQRYSFLQIVQKTKGSILTIGMWNLCNHVTGGGGTACIPTKSAWFFDPLDEWPVDQDIINNFPNAQQDFAKALNAYRTLTHWGFACYVIAIVLTALLIPISFYAFQRRLGSFFALIFNAVSAVFVIAGSAIYTVVFASLRTFINEALAPQFGLHAWLNDRALAATWVASAAVIVAFWFWALTTCCCKGRFDGRHKDAYQMVDVGRAPAQPFGSTNVHGYDDSSNYGYKAPDVHANGLRYEPFRT